MAKQDNENTPSLLDDLPMEMTTAEARIYFERGFKVLADMAENKELDLHARLDALRGIKQYYEAISMPEFIDSNINKVTRSNERTVDQVRKMRKKDWEKDDNADEE